MLFRSKKQTVCSVEASRSDCLCHYDALLEHGWRSYHPYCGAPNRSTQYTSFFMVYREPKRSSHTTCVLTHLEILYDESDADEAMEDDTDVLDEARDIALSRTSTYQQSQRNYHGRRLRARSFFTSDLVLRLKQKKVHKLASPWEGTYIVIEALDNGAYNPKTGELCHNPWNATQLRHFYA